ncbi:MAG: FAD-binding protein [Clostridiales bacterium]|nr:FAD-binding protein [Clostridiales bacterium]
MYDIVIVGAGPGGANLARLISGKYKILLIDKGYMENETPKNLSHKCCGGLLAPDAQKMIAKLGLSLPKDILVNPQIFAVRTIDMTNNIERLYQRFYINFDREKFDKWFVSLVPDQVDKRFNCLFKEFKKIPEGYELKYIHKGQEETVKTRIIIGADGAHSKVRSLINKNENKPKEYIAIQEWFECNDHMPYYGAIFDEEITDFYSWTIPKDNYIILGSALKPKDNSLEKFEKLKIKLKDYGFRFDNKIKREGAYIFRPTKISNLYVGDDNIALIGEAAGAISPSSAQGISYALRTSLHLASCLEDSTEGFIDRYEKKVNDIKIKLLLKKIKSPAMYQPLVRQMAMKSGIQSIR